MKRSAAHSEKNKAASHQTNKQMLQKHVMITRYTPGYTNRNHEGQGQPTKYIKHRQRTLKTANLTKINGSQAIGMIAENSKVKYRNLLSRPKNVRLKSISDTFAIQFIYFSHTTVFMNSVLKACKNSLKCLTAMQQSRKIADKFELIETLLNY
jgi:hypothetical protein